jgi:methylthioribulose 1-phosphate dehydratase / enolase-phosphatase E1
VLSASLLVWWLQAYNLRDAGAVIHSHSINVVLATMLDESSTEFTTTHLEMIKVCDQ